LALIMARAALAARFYDDALVRFAALLNKNFERPEVWANFLDACSSAPHLATAERRDEYQRLLSRGYDRAGRAQGRPPYFFRERDQDITYLRRLSWSFEKLEQWNSAIELLQTALRMEESDAKVRLQLANLLYRQNRFAEANYHYRVIYESRASAAPTRPRTELPRATP